MNILTLNSLQLDVTVSQEPNNDCKGHLYRFKRSYFASAKGHLRLNCEFVPQKRLSCQGCEDCYYLYEISDDDVVEYMEEVEFPFEGFKNNAIYRIVMSFDDDGWASCEFEEYKENIDG